MPAAAAMPLTLSLVLALVLGGCAGRYKRPRTLAAIGAAVATGGTVMWAVGERRDDPGSLPAIGFVTVAAGVAAMVAAGGLIALEVSCLSDPDCDESEECREIPAPPGGVPYKQCMPR
jgi:hypothetical protein